MSRTIHYFTKPNIQIAQYIPSLLPPSSFPPPPSSFPPFLPSYLLPTIPPSSLPSCPLSSLPSSLLPPSLSAPSCPPLSLIILVVLYSHTHWLVQVAEPVSL